MDLAAGNLRRRVEQALVAAVRRQLGMQDAWLVGLAQHHGAGAVAEQHAGAAIIPVQHARHDFGADHQRLLGQAALDVGVGRGQRVDEAGAHGLHVKGLHAGQSQLLLQDAGGAGKNHVGGGGGDDDQVDLALVDAGAGDGGLRRPQRQIAGLVPFVGNMARADAGTRDDPLVAGFHPFGQLRIGKHLGRQEAAGAENAGIAHIFQFASASDCLRLSSCLATRSAMCAITSEPASSHACANA